MLMCLGGERLPLGGATMVGAKRKKFLKIEDSRSLKNAITDSGAVARMLIVGLYVYSYIHVLPERFFFKLINLNLI